MWMLLLIGQQVLCLVKVWIVRTRMVCLKGGSVFCFVSAAVVVIVVMSVVMYVVVGVVMLLKWSFLYKSSFSAFGQFFGKFGRWFYMNIWRGPLGRIQARLPWWCRGRQGEQVGSIVRLGRRGRGKKFSWRLWRICQRGQLNRGLCSVGVALRTSTGDSPGDAEAQKKPLSCSSGNVAVKS